MNDDVGRSDAAAELDEIDRIHDDFPAQAADRLRGLDAAGLPAGRLGSFAFLLNHVLGEKLGAWREAAERIAALAARADAPLPVLRHWAAAALLAEDADLAGHAQSRLAAGARVDASIAAVLARVGALNFAVDAERDAGAFAALARAALDFPPSALDAGFASAFNSVTVALLEKLAGRPLDEAQRDALMLGAEAARAFWLRAGGWIEDERSDYLRAKVALRLGHPEAAATAAERGLAVVEVNGGDPVERAFLLQPLAAALASLGNRERAAALRSEAAALAASFDASLQRLIEQDAAELFAREHA
ncbi:hypothetical protein FBR04_09515 [Betaproteobacteria bacterium PRO7]|jgi:hypothetical protein|nr:hypothetical protein [Betaproteobacteria bacterium PRO7]